MPEGQELYCLGVFHTRIFRLTQFLISNLNGQAVYSLELWYFVGWAEQIGTALLWHGMTAPSILD